MLGATAHSLHYLFSEMYFGQYLQQPTPAFLLNPQATVSPQIAYENPSLGAVAALLLALLVIILCLVFAIAILASALTSHAQARQRLRILWLTNGNLTVQIGTIDAAQPVHGSKDLRCRLEPGCYSSHWLVILCLSHNRGPEQPGRPPKRKRFCILLARDCLSNEGFRHLRLWMRLVAPNQLR